MDAGAAAAQPAAMGQAKRKQQRDCPALGKVITPAECGQARNSEFSCPLDCPHNPFALANYDDFLKLEGKIFGQLSKMLGSEASPTMIREIAATLERNDLFTFQALHSWHLYGEGRVAKWLEEGRFDDWKNDEQVMLNCMATTRPALVEFHQMHDELSWVAVDLLRPEDGSFLAFDSEMAARAGRHDVVLGWVYDIPAGKKIAISAMEVPTVADLMPIQVLERTLEHLGADKSDRDSWIEKNMTLLGEAFVAISNAREAEREAALESSESDVHYAFDPGEYERIVSTLESSPRIVLSEEDFNTVAYIIDDGRERKVPGLATVEGSIDIAPDGLSLYTQSKKDAANCRDLIEALGLPLVFQSEEAPERPATQASYDRDLVPRDFLGGTETEFGHPTIRLDDDELLPALPLCFNPSFADTPHGVLDGATPRKASEDPSLRLRLVALMKGYFRECDRLRSKGQDVDLAPLALELGLKEIVFPAPPLGEEEEEDFDDFSPGMLLTLPPPQPQLDAEEVARRVGEVLSSDESLQEHQLRLVAIFEALKAAESGFNFDERMALFAAVTAAIGAMHPEEPEGFLPDTERMVEWYRQRLSTDQPDETLDDYMTRIATETRQPEVVEAAYRMIGNAADARRLKIRSKRLEQLYTAACAAIWEAAHWPVKL